MAYNYYQTTAPNWGTSNYQFAPPPAVSYHPQPSWRGIDYYNAHASSPDPSFYHRIWNTLTNRGGIDYHSAEDLHRRVYGGLSHITSFRSRELGHAAAFEAYRTWIHNSSIYEPISADRERQREALISLAIAEASRLLHFSGSDRYQEPSRHDRACDSAAATASVLFNKFITEAHHGRHSPFPSYGYPYEGHSDEDRHSYRSRRHSSSSSHMIHPPSPYMGAAVSAPPPVAIHAGGSPYLGAQYPMGNSPYGNSPYGSAYNIAQPGYASPYVQQPAYNVAGIPGSQGSTLIIQQPSGSSYGDGHRHRHHHHHKHSHRHRTYSDAAAYPATGYTYGY